jgi:hypothetical protein
VRRLLSGFAVVATAVAALLSPPEASAASVTGPDVSYPQCGGALPITGSFGIVGLNNGLPYSVNPCVADQWTWASGFTAAPALYANTANPGGTSGFYTYPTGNDPAVCGTDKTSSGCAYNYGWHAALDALDEAANAGIVNRLSVTWWLDVETANSWNGSVYADTAALQGFRDALRTAGVARVGLYSNASAWSEITNSYRRSTVSYYRSQWAPYFTPKYPLEDAPLWIAGTGTESDASALCTTSFTQGQTLLAQYTDGAFDADLQCATPDTTAPTVSLTGPAVPYVLSTTVTATWSASDQGGAGLASYDVRYSKALADGGFGALSYPSTWQRMTATRVSLATQAGSTVCFSVRARDGAGNVSGWTAQRCTAVPFDDRSLTRSGAWTLPTVTNAYLHTITQSSTSGASVYRANLRTQRLLLVATRCPSCGSVRVYVGSTLLTTVRLYAATTAYHSVIALPRFSLRQTTVTIRVYGSGHAVAIDGLISSRV